MRASILYSHPFLIPVGTKVKLTLLDPTVECGTVFFAGYKTFGRNILHDTFDIFAIFKKPTKKGEMSHFNIDLFDGFIAKSDLDRCDIEILELPAEGLYTANRENRFNDCLSNLVAVCTAEMLDIAHRKGVVSVVFKDHPKVEAPYATFNDDGGHYAWCPVTELVFNFDENQIIVRGDDHGTVWMGYLDGSWGDYFDVGHSFGHIYEAFVKIAV